MPDPRFIALGRIDATERDTLMQARDAVRRRLAETAAGAADAGTPAPAGDPGEQGSR